MYGVRSCVGYYVMRLKGAMADTVGVKVSTFFHPH